MIAYSTRLTLLCGVILLLSGCARPTPEETVRMLWPVPPTQPRLEHIGNFQAESDFPRDEGNLAKMFREFVGDIEAESALLNPQDVYVNSDLVYVSDSARKNIVVFNFKDCRISQLIGNEALVEPLENPHGIAADDAGNLYLLDTKKRTVYTFSNKGALLGRFTDTERLIHPTDIALDRSGRIYVSDMMTHAIVVYDSSGRHLFNIGQRGAAPGELTKPAGITFDRFNRLYVADCGNSRVQVFTGDGEFIRTIGRPGHTAYTMSKPVDVAISSSGNLYILDQDYFALLTYAPDDTVLLVTGTGTESKDRLGFGKPTSLFIDHNDRIYITDRRNSRLAIWQILSADYLAKHPVTEADISRLKAYLSDNQPAP